MARGSLIIRPAELADIAPVLELWSHARSAHATTPDHESDLRRLIVGGPGTTLLVAFNERGLVGTLIAAWDGWRGNMYRLAVSPKHRREGVARQLVERGEQRLRDLGARRVTALVAHGDLTAAAFWDAAGYPADPEIGRHVRNI
ncbi:MAG: GNAT family N-acetyltransferase [Solirubrobacteraceae bacterium]